MTIVGKVWCKLYMMSVSFFSEYWSCSREIFMWHNSWRYIFSSPQGIYIYIALNTQNTGWRQTNQEWAIQRYWQHWAHKTQDEDKQIKNEQSRDTGNNGHTKHRMKTNKTRMSNPEILATLGTQSTGWRQTNQEWTAQHRKLNSTKTPGVNPGTHKG